MSDEIKNFINQQIKLSVNPKNKKVTEQEIEQAETIEKESEQNEKTKVTENKIDQDNNEAVKNGDDIQDTKVVKMEIPHEKEKSDRVQIMQDANMSYVKKIEAQELNPMNHQHLVDHYQKYFEKTTYNKVNMQSEFEHFVTDAQEILQKQIIELQNKEQKNDTTN